LGWRNIIRAEVIGQMAHFYLHGEYPKDQMAFAKAISRTRSSLSHVGIYTA
jgi:hypothetical protein